MGHATKKSTKINNSFASPENMNNNKIDFAKNKSFNLESDETVVGIVNEEKRNGDDLIRVKKIRARGRPRKN